MLATNASTSTDSATYLAQSFDPQKVVGLVVSGTYTFTLVSAATTCPNALNITDCSVIYNGASWVFSAAITNPSAAKENGCSITGDFGSGNTPAAMNCPTTTPATFTVAEDVYSSLQTSTTYSFTITAESDNESVSCEASTTLSPTSLTCYLSAQTAVAGSGSVPALNYAFSNCPSDGCDYTVSLTGPSSADLGDGKGTFTNGSAVSSWYPSDLTNSGTSPLAAGEYTYTLTPTTPSNLSGCTYSFTVTESNAPTVTSCSVTDAGVFTATVSNTSSVTYDYSLVVTDAQSNVISGKTTSGSSNTTSFSGTITPPTTAGSYIYTLTATYGDESSYCNQTLTVESSSSSSATTESSSSAAVPTVTCGVSTYNYAISGGDTFYDTQTLYFMAQNTTNESDTYTVTVYNGSTSLGTATLNNYSNWSNLVSIGYLSAGNYTYSVAYNDEVVCSHTITVAEPVGCSVSSTTIGLGEGFTFTTTYPGSCYGSTFTADPSDGSGISSPTACQSSYSVTPTVVGTYTYTYGVTNGSYGTDSCSQTVTVERVAPTFTCPSSAKASIGASNNVSLSLSDVTGCDEGGNYCYYSIVGTNINESGNSYTGSSLPSFTDGNVTSASTKTYTIRLTNSVGYVEHDCDVEFVEGSVATPISVGKGEENFKSFTPGTTYAVTITGGGGVFRCVVSSAASYVRPVGTFNGTTFDIDAYNTGSRNNPANPGTGSTVTFVVDSDAPSDLRCGTDW